MATGLAPAVANALLNAIFNQDDYTAPTAVWVKLHVGDPGAAGTANPATETTRKELTSAMGSPSNGSITSTAPLQWTSVAATEDYTHASLWTDPSAGSFLASGAITANAVTAGDNFTLQAGDIDFDFPTAA